MSSYTDDLKSEWSASIEKDAYVFYEQYSGQTLDRYQQSHKDNDLIPIGFEVGDICHA